MLNKIEDINTIRNITKKQLINKIKKAKTDISMIGTIAFDLPWKELEDDLCSKFQNEDFAIHILRESETIIAQYALLNLSQDEYNDYGNLSRGNLIGIKDKVINELKMYLSKSNEGKNIEPPEDKYAQQLGEIYYKEKRKYILKSYQINGCEAAFSNYMKQRIHESIFDMRNTIFGDQKFITKLAEKIKDDPGFAARYSDEIDRVLNKSESIVNDYLANVNLLFAMDKMQKNPNISISINKKGETFIKVPIIVDAENLVIQQEAVLPLEKWIEDFSMETDADVNYRLLADKSQAVKRAMEVKQNELEKYKADTDKRQRIFIKNCYMPIPVPMIKIDNELFITMALTEFDGVQKFQYIGDIEYDEEFGCFQIGEGQYGYKSLWLEEFTKYYIEYFANENGAQKYSTEETMIGNRKEVIDIFDENRNRIGIGPRDAFLSNMAIVKSVVWALIFDRKGRILIHQRAKNAKDNQGLWDKSVGGHVSTEDLDTIESIKREIAEELFTIEHEGQGGHDTIEWMITNKNKIIYLGDWKTTRFPNLSALHLSPDEYYNFSLNYPDINRRDFRKEIVITERVQPNGEAVKAKCFVDAYLCIVSEDFDIKKLQNSKYALLTPNELKRCVMKKKICLNDKREYDLEEGTEEEFKPTSDLAYLIESAIWDDVVTEFAKRVRETFA